MSELDDDKRAEHLAFRICTLREEGHWRDAADLCGDLIACDPTRLDFRFLELDLLHRCKDRPALEARLEDALACLPDSLELQVYFAAVPMWYFDWSVAIERLREIRRRFSHVASVDVAATVLDEFLCCFEIGDLEGCRKLVATNWLLLKSWPASRYNGKNEIFEIVWMIEDKNFDAYVSWSSEALAEDLRKNYVARMEAASKMRAWVAQNASQIDVVSIGQNCLPWVVPNRWGLRPDWHTAKPMSVFDYIGAPKESVFDLIENRFSDLLSDENLVESPFPNGAPMLMNKKYRILFFHEKGAWWAANGWHRLRDAYRERVRFFLDHGSSRARLYVFCVNGPCDLDRAVRSFEEALSRNDARLLILNAQQTPVETEVANAHVTLKNLPYPSDYSYVDRPSFEGDDGHVFESAVAASIMSELQAMCRPSSKIEGRWRRIKAAFER